MLSVIIVNYNVKYFLEQCLFSVYKAGNNRAIEVIVIDNNSSDGSAAYLQPIFPELKYYALTENLGFAKACNYGLQLSGGSHILFLNPDTILPEDCFEKCIAFLDAQKNAGALGVRMLDGSGNFLKESKRGNPSLAATFFKLSGLSSLFPNSALFSKYYLAHIPEHQTSEVDILAGAFMMIKKNTLDATGSFDECFFMYGEDIDLSYRIQQAGYSNYYLPEVSIIHFKGESTQKESYRYIKTFYKAMSIFVKKHYKGGKGMVYRFFIEIAIFLRALISSGGRLVTGISRALKTTPPAQKAIKYQQALHFTGSSAACSNARVLAENAGFSVSANTLTFTELSRNYEYPLIFCEGENTMYKDIIQQMDSKKPADAMIYSSGSKSIIGSPEKNESGITIA